MQNKNLSVRGVPWWVGGLAGLLKRWRPVRWPRWNGWLVYWPAGVWVGWVRRAQIHFRGRRFPGHLWFSQFANKCKAFFPKYRQSLQWIRVMLVNKPTRNMASSNKASNAAATEAKAAKQAKEAKQAQACKRNQASKGVVWLILPGCFLRCSWVQFWVSNLAILTIIL